MGGTFARSKNTQGHRVQTVLLSGLTGGREVDAAGKHAACKATSVHFRAPLGDHAKDMHVDDNVHGRCS